MKVLTGIAVVVFLAAGIAFSEERQPETMTLEQALALAGAQSPVIAGARRREEGAQAGLAAARGARAGVATAVAGWTRYQDDITVRPISRDLVTEGLAGLPFDRTQHTAGIRVEVPLYSGGRLGSGISSARARVEAFSARTVATEDDVLAQVRSLYGLAQAASVQRDAAAAWRLALEARMEHVGLMVEVGRAPRVDLARVRAGLARARSAESAAAAEYRATLAHLLALLGADPTARPDLEPLPERLPTVTLTEEDLRVLTMDSPPLRAAAAATEAARHDWAVERGARRPQVLAAGSWVSHGAPSLDGRLETWNAGVNLRVLLFDGGSSRARMAAAQAAAAAAEADARQARQIRQAELEAALARWEAAQVAVAEARTTRREAAEVRDTERVRYETGAGPIQDLLDAEAELAAASARESSARAEALAVAADFGRITGREVAK